MPLGIAIGRYSEHVKISTECQDDDVTADGDDPWPVQYIGQQNIPLYNSKNISGMMNQIYNKNYSRINSLINLKRYRLSVDTSGINVHLASSSKKNGGVSSNLFMNYSLTDILLVTTDYQHDQLFAIIFYGPLRNCVLHLYICNGEDDVRNIMNKCNEEFVQNKEIKQIDRSTYSDGLEIIHFKPYEKSDDPDVSLNDVLKENDNGVKSTLHDIEHDSSKSFKAKNTPMTDITQFRIPYDKVDVNTKTSREIENDSLNNIKDKTTPMVDITQFRIPYDKVDIKEDDDAFNFGAFQTMSCSTGYTKTINSPTSIQTSTTRNNVNLLDDADDLEDEFAELALKRNIYMPEHLQDKSIENTLLFQDAFTNSANNEQMCKPGFFSSYNKLQS